MPNHAPTPATHTANVGMAPVLSCAQLKARYGIVTQPNAKSSPKPNESHHLFQHAAMKNIISNRSAGPCIVLAGSRHKIINKLQIRGNCPGPGPTTFGGLKKRSRDQLQHVFRKQGMSKKHARAAADCVIAEAETEAKKNLPKGSLTDSTPVAKVKGCLVAGTLVWLDAHTRAPIEQLRPGHKIHTAQGALTIVRTDTCVNEPLDIQVGGGRIGTVGFHRFRLNSGAYRRADALGLGSSLATGAGGRTVTWIEQSQSPVCLYSIGFERDAECQVGEAGVISEWPYAGPAVQHWIHPSRLAS